MMMSSSSFFRYFLFLGQQGPSEVCRVGTRWMWNFPVFLLKFRSGELVACGIKFRIQRVPTRHNFDRLHYPKNKKYLKDAMMTFLVFGVAGSVKNMSSGYSLDAKFNFISNELSLSKFDQTHREICRKYEQKSSFFVSSSKINKYYFIILAVILLFSLEGPFQTSNFL